MPYHDPSAEYPEIYKSMDKAEMDLNGEVGKLDVELDSVARIDPDKALERFSALAKNAEQVYEDSLFAVETERLVALATATTELGKAREAIHSPAQEARDLRNETQAARLVAGAGQDKNRARQLYAKVDGFIDRKEWEQAYVYATAAETLGVFGAANTAASLRGILENGNPDIKAAKDKRNDAMVRAVRTAEDASERRIRQMRRLQGMAQRKGLDRVSDALRAQVSRASISSKLKSFEAAQATGLPYEGTAR
jgi:hypothetical protein